MDSDSVSSRMGQVSNSLKNQIVFIVQICMLVCVIVFSLYQISVGVDREIYLTLLSSSLGYLLPNPSPHRIC